MVEAVYSLCGLASLMCALLLLRAYRRTKTKLLLWSGLCFVAMTVNSLLLILDWIILPQLDFYPVRTFVMLVGLFVLLYGLIWEKA